MAGEHLPFGRHLRTQAFRHEEPEALAAAVQAWLGGAGEKVVVSIQWVATSRSVEFGEYEYAELVVEPEYACFIVYTE